MTAALLERADPATNLAIQSFEAEMLNPSTTLALTGRVYPEAQMHGPLDPIYEKPEILLGALATLEDKGQEAMLKLLSERAKLALVEGMSRTYYQQELGLPVKAEVPLAATMQRLVCQGVLWAAAHERKSAGREIAVEGNRRFVVPRQK